MALEFTTSYVADSIAVLHYYKKLAERAMEQCSEADLQRRPGAGENSIAQIVKHLAGNMRSRWTDFLTSDGEKPDRNRDSEFEDPPADRAALLAQWEAGWGLVFAALEPLADTDLGRTVTIRGEPHSVMQAIHRQVTHYTYHVGQIVLLARQFRGGDWHWLSIPPGRSEEFLRRVKAGEASQR